MKERNHLRTFVVDVDGKLYGESEMRLEGEWVADESAQSRDGGESQNMKVDGIDQQAKYRMKIEAERESLNLVSVTWEGKSKHKLEDEILVIFEWLNMILEFCLSFLRQVPAQMWNLNLFSAEILLSPAMRI